MAPLIGLTIYARNDDGRFHLPADYVTAVRRAGGIPVLMAPGEPNLDLWFESLDALILTGGGDLNPDLYGGPGHQKIYHVDDERDRDEMRCARHLVESDMPGLCICRGLQILNIELGGSLITHLPDVVGEDVPHRRPDAGPLSHVVHLEPTSRLGKLMGKAEFEATSWHHQALDTVAPGLEVVARAPDGVIEAVDVRDRIPTCSPCSGTRKSPPRRILCSKHCSTPWSSGPLPTARSEDDDNARSTGGRTALITGAASGIGRESALLFAQQGASVAVVDMQDDGGNATVRDIEAAGGKAIYVRADVSVAADCEQMVRATESAFGKLDVLFNNAGIMHGHDGDAEATEEEVWDLTMAVNLKGVYLGCKYGIPALRRAGGGSIVNTASFVALLGAATPQLAYTASKGGVLAMTRELAVIHARENIRVNALCPGPLRTELLMKFLDTEEKKQRRLVHVPMGRFGEASEMAQAALFLASDESSYLTGSTFTVDGGITAAYVTPE